MVGEEVQRESIKMFLMGEETVLPIRKTPAITANSDPFSLSENCQDSSKTKVNK